MLLPLIKADLRLKLFLYYFFTLSILSQRKNCFYLILQKVCLPLKHRINSFSLPKLPCKTLFLWQNLFTDCLSTYYVPGTSFGALTKQCARDKNPWYGVYILVEIYFKLHLKDARKSSVFITFLLAYLG